MLILFINLLNASLQCTGRQHMLPHKRILFSLLNVIILKYTVEISQASQPFV